MTSQEIESLTAFNQRLTKQIEIRLFLSDDPRSTDLQAFCRKLEEAAPRVQTVEDADATGPLPAIGIGERMRYCGVPSGNELAPFLEALCYLDAHCAPALPLLPAELNSLDTPAALQVFVTPPCGFCPAVVRRLLPLAFAPAPFYLTVIDAALFPEIAAARHIRSVPTALLDDQLRWTGMVDLAELGRAAASRDPVSLGGETLGRILQSHGGAYQLAAMMHRRGNIFPAFIELLTDERFTIRLAAMVTIEDLLVRDGDLARQVVAPMLKRYPRAADAVKGDILYLFGAINAAEALPLLHQTAAADPNQEIRESAAEALEKIDTDHPPA